MERDGDRSRIVGQTFIRKLLYYPVLDSTSDEAARLCRDGRVDPDRSLPTLVWTRVQTAGRGRGGHSWWAGDGALTFTLILDRRRLSIPQSQLQVLGPLTGLVVANTLNSLLHNQRVQLKWPNDVWLNGKKVSGILVEQVTAVFPAVLIGIGINVNNSFKTAPQNLRSLATSLIDQTGHEWNLVDLLVNLLQGLEKTLKQATVAVDTLPVWWDRYCCLTGRVVTVGQGNRHVTGRCLGLRSDGALRLQTDFGEQAVCSGTVIRVDGTS